MELGRKPSADAVFFDDVDRSYVVDQLEGVLDDPVEIELTVRRGSPLILRGSRAGGAPAGFEEGRRAQRLLEELRALVPALHVEVRDGGEDVPVFRIGVPGADGVRFAGVPRVNLFRAFLETIRRASTHDYGLRPDWGAALAALAVPVHALVFATPTCPSCPPVVMTAIRMALASSNLDVEVVDGIAGMDRVREWGVSGVPTVILDGRIAVEGPVPEDVLLEFVRHAADRDYPPPAISSVPFPSCGRLEVG